MNTGTEAKPGFDSGVVLQYARADRWQFVRRWTKRLGFAVGGIMVCVIAARGWLYWGWKIERNAVDRLHVMRVHWTPMGGERLKSLLGGYSWLIERVDYIAIEAPATDADLVELGRLTRIEFLDLNGAKVTDAGLAAIEKLTHLRWIYLNDASISDEGLKHLVGFLRLEVLELRRTNIGDTGMGYLDGLHLLKELDCDGTKVGDTGARHISTHANLRVLSLNGTLITDKAVPFLNDLKNLRILGIAETTITRKGLDDLASSIEFIEFSGTPAGKTVAP